MSEPDGRSVSPLCKADNMGVETLAGREHWDAVYDRRGGEGTSRIVTYDERVLADVLLTACRSVGATSVLEVGCGDSVWLPYLAHELKLKRVAGVDYVPRGCELVARRLNALGIAADIRCADVFTLNPEEVGRFDVVYSLGLVEHFPDTAAIVRRLAAFVRPGGLLLTEVPNLRSMHGLLGWIWQPELLAKHKLLNVGQLTAVYREIGLDQVRGWYAGLFSLNIVAWPLYPRWPRLTGPVTRLMARLSGYLERFVLSRTTCYRGAWPTAPFLVVCGSPRETIPQEAS